jgi:membrane protein
MGQKPPRGSWFGLRILWSAVRKFDADNGFFLASGLAFNLLLSVVPGMLLLLSLTGTYLYSDAEVTEHIAQYFRDLVPSLDPKIMSNLMGIIHGRKVAGAIAVAGLVWTASMAFGSLRTSLDMVFGVEQGRGTLRGKAVDLLMILVAGSTFLASMLLTSWINVIQRYGASFSIDLGPLLTLVLKYLLPFLFTLLMSFLILTIVPDRKTPPVPALKAALFTSLLWEAAKQLFGFYVLHAGTYSLVYGSLSTIALFFLWIYYSAAIFLLGAEVAFALEQRQGRDGA